MLDIRRAPSQRGRTMFMRHRWTVHGIKQGSSAADLTTKLAAMKAGYANITGDVVYLDNNGAETEHKIPYAQTINGIRGDIVYPGAFSPPPGGWGAGVEYVYTRYFVAQIEADVLSIENNILRYQQNMQFSLGGARYKVVGAFTGPPQVQFTMQQSPFWAVQRGFAIGAFTNPNPADPLLAVPVDPDRSWVDHGTPEIQGLLRNIGLPTRWHYYYESPWPLNAVPPPNP